VPKPQPRYSKEEFARRGEAIFERDIRPHLKPGHDEVFVLIDIETGAYEIDADELRASDRLRALSGRSGVDEASRLTCRLPLRATSRRRGSVITGVVTAAREATIPLMVYDAAGDGH
jgi:hypothetical protein